MTVGKQVDKVRLANLDRALSGFESLVGVQRAHSAIKGMRGCNTRPIPEPADLQAEEVDLKLRIARKGVRFTGLQTCKNANCLYCMESVRSAHVRRLAHGIEEAVKRGWTPYFFTGTHQTTDSADLAIHRCGKGWERIRQHLRNTLGKQGIRYHYCRAYDVTFSQNRDGIYHVHIHAVIMVDSFVSTKGDDGSIWMHGILDAAWRRNNRHAVAAAQKTERVKTESMSRYMAKWYGIAHEISNSVKKDGRAAGSMTLIGLMERAAEDEEHAAIYTAYTQATRRKRMIQFSGRAQGSEEWYPWEDPPREEDPEETEEDPREEEITIPVHWWSTIRPMQDRATYAVWYGTFIARSRAVEDLKVLLSLDVWAEPLIYDQEWRARTFRAWLKTYLPWRANNQTAHVGSIKKE